MNEPRPTVSPLVIASAVERAPERVRRRLDREPTAATVWKWNCRESMWEVEAGDECVKLPLGSVRSLEQVACTCLLAPNCFHVLACLTSLAVADADEVEETGQTGTLCEDETSRITGEGGGGAWQVRAKQEAGTLDEPESRELSLEQRQAARTLREAVERLLRVGVAAAGVVVQSSVLRAAHSCRAEGLPRAAELALRVVAGVGSYRAKSVDADPAQLADDLAALLETTHWLDKRASASIRWLGESRRAQQAISPRRLHGLLAEPVVTRGGHAGAAVYLLGEDGRIYTAADVRPGEPTRARDAYRGGIDIGPITEPACRLARGHFVAAEMTASRSGRLGRGQGARIVVQGTSSWEEGPIRERFQRPYKDQWLAVFRQFDDGGDDRPAGVDFVFVTGVVRGAVGPELLFQLTPCGTLLRLAIENEEPSLAFRENLRMLSYCPGLELRLIGRLRADDPLRVYPLAIAPAAGVTRALASSDNSESADAVASTASTGEPAWLGGEERAGPRLELGDGLGDRVCLGFDELTRRRLPGSEAKPRVLTAWGLDERFVASVDDSLAALRRRWVSTLIAGAGSQRGGSGTTLQAESAALARAGLETAAALNDALSRLSGASDKAAGELFLAVWIYLRASQRQLLLTRLPFV